MDHKWIQGSLCGTLRVVSGLHVGGDSEGKDGTQVTSVVRDGKGRPFVPGSSLKGAIRSQAQVSIKTLTDAAKSAVWACDFPESLDNESLSFCLRGGSASGPCALCKLFGSTINPSRVFARDLSLCEEWSESLMQHRATLGISRRFRRGIEGSGRIIEVIPPGLSFRFEILVSEPLDWELGLIFWVIENLDKGLGRLGGGRRLGLGNVSLQVSQVVMQRVNQGLCVTSEVYLPRSAVPAPDESERPEAEKLYGLPKPDTDDMGAVLSYCLRVMEIKNTQADAGEIGKLLSSEFGLTRGRRKELGLPEKVSELLDKMVLEDKLVKNYLGHYGISPGYIQKEAPPKDRAQDGESTRLDLDEFRTRCEESLRGMLFVDARAANDAQ
ncbi:MAG: hypothetical protein JW759_02175 [Candidatus Coatesbacteria bacterium]|nr:hypothetical protein [Candidatus Coatesbacteria bacterium]